LSTSPRATRRERRAEQRRHERPGSVPPRVGGVSASPSRWRSPLVLVTGVAILATVVVIGVLILGGGRPQAGDTLGVMAPPDSAAAAYADGHAIGSVEAPVVLEVYSDYQCPVCGRFSREYLPRLVATFVASGDLRIEERAIAFLGTTSPDESLDAAAAAACAAPSNRYWQFHDYLMWNQDGENEGAFRRERLAVMAERVGLERPAFDACLDDEATREPIRQLTADAGATGITSTPTFVVDGERVVGLVPYDELAALIQARVDAAGA
jgi:protein-disulfide isomerase